MADETTAKRRSVEITNGDIAAIAFQMCLIGLSTGMVSLQHFSYAFAAYAGMAASIGWRAKKHGLTPNDRNALLFGFIPIFFLAATLSTLIWHWKYP